ncbi:hypothetical protein BN7874_164 [Phage NCTB]|jgi:HD-like signal output (HDOD) protein|nr:hypothetical protein BN7874_164 [Phage NCTB]
MVNEFRHLFAILLDKITSDTLVLPTLPEIAMRVSQEANKPDVELRDIAEVIKNDPALTARIIRIANSAQRGSRVNKVTDLNRALTRIGLIQIKNVSLALAMEQIFVTKNPVIKKAFEDTWKRTLKINSNMMALHKSYVINTGNRDIAADELALTGMVHLIGMLPIIAEANNNKQFADEKFLEQANNLLASRIGKSITSTWEFPSSCIYAVEVWNKYKLRRSEVTYVDFIRGAYAIEDLIADRVIAEQVFDDLTSKGILPSIEYIQSDVYKRDVVLANEIYGD